MHTNRFVDCFLNFVTLNTNGTGNEQKRKALWRWAHDHKTDVLFWQETHSDLLTENIWRKQWNGYSLQIWLKS